MKEETMKRLRALSSNKIEKKLDIKAYGETLELSIYGDIEPDYYDWWTGETIESETSANYFKKILDEHPNVNLIRLNINSMGGYVSEGNAIYALLKRHTAQVHVYVDGFACSMASAIAMAGDTIKMAPNALMMIHNPWTWACGNSKELRKAAEDLDSMAEAFRQSYLLKAGDKLDENALIEMLDAETFLTARECLAYGLCDEIENVDSQALAQAKEQIQAHENTIKELQEKLEAYEKQNTDTQPAQKSWFF